MDPRPLAATSSRLYSAGRQDRVNVEPSPSRESTSTRALVVAGHVADDRETEAGATGRAAAPVVDPVEALEDALEVAGGDARRRCRPPRAGSRRRPGRPRPRRCRPRRRRSRRSRGGCGWPRRAGGGRPARRRGVGLVELDLDVALLRRAAHPLDGLGHDEVDETGSRGGASSDSIRERSSRSSMIRLTRKASAWIREASRWATSGSGSTVGSRPAGPARPSASSARG